MFTPISYVAHFDLSYKVIIYITIIYWNAYNFIFFDCIENVYLQGPDQNILKEFKNYSNTSRNASHPKEGKLPFLSVMQQLHNDIQPK